MLSLFSRNSPFRQLAEVGTGELLSEGEGPCPRYLGKQDQSLEALHSIYNLFWGA